MNENSFEMLMLYIDALNSDFNFAISWYHYIKTGLHFYNIKAIHGSITGTSHFGCRKSMCKTTRPTVDGGRARNLVKSPHRSDTEDNQELILLALVLSCSCVPMLVMNIHGDTIG